MRSHPCRYAFGYAPPSADAHADARALVDRDRYAYPNRHTYSDPYHPSNTYRYADLYPHRHTCAHFHTHTRPAHRHAHCATCCHTDTRPTFLRPCPPTWADVRHAG